MRSRFAAYFIVGFLTVTALAGVASAQNNTTAPTTYPPPTTAYPTSSPPPHSYALSEECQKLKDAINAKLAALNAEQQRARDEFYAQQEAKVREFGAAAHTDEEWARFKAELQAARDAFESRLRQAHEALMKDLWANFNASCGTFETTIPGPAPPPTGMTPPPTAAPAGWTLPDVCRGREAILQEMMGALHPEIERLMKALYEKVEQKRQAFMATTQTKEAWMAFESEMRTLREAAEGEIKAHARTWAVAHGILDCFEAMADHMGGGFAGGFGGGPGGPAPVAPNMPPMPANAMPSPADEAAHKIFAECAQRMQELVGPYMRSMMPTAPMPLPMPMPAPLPAAPDGGSATSGTLRFQSTSPAAGLPALPAAPLPAGSVEVGVGMRMPAGLNLPPDLVEKIHALERECRQKAMAAFGEQVRDAEHFEDVHGTLKMYADGDLIKVVGRFIGMIGRQETQAMTEMTVNGLPVIDSLTACGYLARFQPTQTDKDYAIDVFDDANRLVLEVTDTVRGVIHMNPSEKIPCARLDFVDTATLHETPEGFTIDFGGVKGTVLAHGARQMERLDGNVLLIRGQATFALATAAAVYDTLGDGYSDAVETGAIGAETVVGLGDDGIEAASETINDVQVDIDESATSAEGNVVTAVLESAEHARKTVAFLVDKALGVECATLHVAATDVLATGAEVPVDVREAASLDDVLETEGRPDGVIFYWCVSDRLGEHVLVSSTFSKKKVTMSSADADAAGGGSGLPGFEAAIVVAAVGVALIASGLRRGRSP